MTRPNPSRRGGRRPVYLLTDRAKRYRAQQAIEQTEPRCIYCGRPRLTGRQRNTEHINGREADNSPANLAFACRSCNTRKGAVFARAGKGKRTAQYNPGRRGAGTLAEYIEAVMTTKGEGSGRFSLPQAVELLRNTPPDDRSIYASMIWDLRRARGTSRKSEVPF
jgi:hypothetical protein